MGNEFREKQLGALENIQICAKEFVEEIDDEKSIIAYDNLKDALDNYDNLCIELLDTLNKSILEELKNE